MVLYAQVEGAGRGPEQVGGRGLPAARHTNTTTTTPVTRDTQELISEEGQFVTSAAFIVRSGPEPEETKGATTEKIVHIT